MELLKILHGSRPCISTYVNVRKVYCVDFDKNYGLQVMIRNTVRYFTVILGHRCGGCKNSSVELRTLLYCMSIVSRLLCCKLFVLECCCALTYGQRCQDAEVSLLLSLEASEEQVKALAQPESTQVYQLCPSQPSSTPSSTSKGRTPFPLQGIQGHAFAVEESTNPIITHPNIDTAIKMPHFLCMSQKAEGISRHNNSQCYGTR